MNRKSLEDAKRAHLPNAENSAEADEFESKLALFKGQCKGIAETKTEPDKWKAQLALISLLNGLESKQLVQLLTQPADKSKPETNFEKLFATVFLLDNYYYPKWQTLIRGESPQDAALNLRQMQTLRPRLEKLVATLNNDLLSKIDQAHLMAWYADMSPSHQLNFVAVCGLSNHVQSVLSELSQQMRKSCYYLLLDELRNQAVDQGNSFVWRFDNETMQVMLHHCTPHQVYTLFTRGTDTENARFLDLFLRNVNAAVVGKWGKRLGIATGDVLRFADWKNTEFYLINGNLANLQNDPEKITLLRDIANLVNDPEKVFKINARKCMELLNYFMPSLEDALKNPGYEAYFVIAIDALARFKKILENIILNPKAEAKLQGKLTDEEITFYLADIARLQGNIHYVESIRLQNAAGEVKQGQPNDKQQQVLQASSIRRDDACTFWISNDVPSPRWPKSEVMLIAQTLLSIAQQQVPHSTANDRLLLEYVAYNYLAAVQTKEAAAMIESKWAALHGEKKAVVVEKKREIQGNSVLANAGLFQAEEIDPTKLKTQLQDIAQTLLLQRVKHWAVGVIHMIKPCPQQENLERIKDVTKEDLLKTVGAFVGIAAEIARDGKLKNKDVHAEALKIALNCLTGSLTNFKEFMQKQQGMTHEI